jgi:hypothetical protein
MSVRFLLTLTLAMTLGAACGGSGDDDSSGQVDAALGADSNEILPDAADMTACGDDPIIYCERATEICVQRSAGAGFTYSCEPLPDGCDAERSCDFCAEACGSAEFECADSDGDNTLSCECVVCA